MPGYNAICDGITTRDKDHQEPTNPKLTWNSAGMQGRRFRANGAVEITATLHVLARYTEKPTGLQQALVRYNRFKVIDMLCEAHGQIAAVAWWY